MPLDLESVLEDTVTNISPSTKSPKNRVYNFHNRKKRAPKQPLHQIFLRPETIAETLKHRCKHNCFATKISAHDVATIRNQYISKSGAKKNEWIRNYLEHNVIVNGSCSSTRWHLNGKSVCKSCWMLATTVSSYKLKHCYVESTAGLGIKRISPRLETVIAWLGTYFDSICEKMPTKNEFHLPNFIFWSDVLEELNDYLDENENYHQLSPSYFSKVF